MAAAAHPVELGASWEPTRREPPPTRFHRVHGANIRVDPSGTQATRVESFAHGVCFSRDPLAPGQIFLVEIEEKELGWCGHLRLGLTALDPASLAFVPEFSLPDLVNLGHTWVFAITRHHNRVPREGQSEAEAAAPCRPPALLVEPYLCIEQFRIPRDRLVGRSQPGLYSHLLDQLYELNVLPPTARRSRLGVLFCPHPDGTADMHIIINGEDMGPSARGLPAAQPLYAVVDVFASTKSVRLVQLEYGLPSLQTLCRLVIQRSVVHRLAIDGLHLPRGLKDFCNSHFIVTTGEVGGIHRSHFTDEDTVAQNCPRNLPKELWGAAMSYFWSPQAHPGLLPSGQGGAASPGPSLGLYSAAEPVVVASGGPGPLSQKAEQMVPGAQAEPEARHCPGGASWETLPKKEYSRYCHQLCLTRPPENLGWEHGCSTSRAPPLGGPSRTGPLVLCGVSPGVLPVPSETGGKEASGTQPDICILTLAMMIAGIPTVPVPGLREEDLIRAAQAFMLAHPEPERAVEGVQWIQTQAHRASGETPLARSWRGQPPGPCL